MICYSKVDWSRVFGLVLCGGIFAAACCFAEDESESVEGGVVMEHGPDWVLVAEEAGWSPRDSHGEFVFKNHLWILGGWVGSKVPNPRDVWKSPDGKNWICVIEEAPWEHSDLSAYMIFKDRMWFMGGRKLPGAENSNKVWSSSDGAEWVLETDDPGWCARVSPAFAVFKDRMWFMGGSEDFYKDTDENLKNDVWSTADGKNWKLKTANAPWRKRTHARAVVFDGKLWIMGGGRAKGRGVEGFTPMFYNDVWCSEDGVNWREVTPAAPWAPRIWFSLVVYRDRMWVLGGWNLENGNHNDVWYSSDGKNWTQLKSENIWSERHEHSALVFQDKIWVYGGCPPGKLVSDVWTLELPR